MATRPSELRRALVMAAVGAPLLAWRHAFAATGCKPGVTSLMGPAYRPNAPLRSALCAAGEPGTKLRMSGTVADAETCKGLGKAVLEVWQVNAAGEYDMNSGAYRFRGRIPLDKGGAYAFDSVVPAPYGRRARHIHYLVSCPGYEPYITQSYFADDELLAKDRLFKPPLAVTLRRVGERMEGSFDLVLQRERPADAAAKAAWPDYVGVYELGPQVTLTISQAAGALRWRLDPVEQAGDPVEGVLHARSATRFFCAEYDLFATFVRDEHGRVSHLQTNDGPLAPKRA